VLLGVVADTHGFLNPRLKVLFRGVDAILHAGDIEAQAVLDALADTAPVTAVHGNCDRGLLVAEYPAWQELAVEGHKLLLLHRGGKMLRSDLTTSAIVRHVQPDIIVSGHTHQPLVVWEDGVYLFNPGLAGRPHFGQRPTAGLLAISAEKVEGQIVDL
jgi:uncharacterized protein